VKWQAIFEDFDSIEILKIGLETLKVLEAKLT